MRSSWRARRLRDGAQLDRCRGRRRHRLRGRQRASSTARAIPPERAGGDRRGSGCDFIRTFGIPKNTRAGAWTSPPGGTTRTIDVGRVRFTGPRRRARPSGASRTSPAPGMTGIAADQRQPLGQAAGRDRRVRLGGGARRSSATATARFVVQIDDRAARNASRNNVIVANCRYFAGGMKILPDAEPDDGAARRAGLGRHLQGRPGAEPAQALPRHARHPPEGRDRPRACSITVTPISRCRSRSTARCPG